MIDKSINGEINHSELQIHLGREFSEEIIQHYENKILEAMKYRQEKYPNKKNSDELLDFKDFVCKRRQEKEKHDQ